MDNLHARLDAITEKNLPPIKANAASLLAKFDADNNGMLDKEEFRRFSRVYFSRLEFPLWRVAAKGFAIGCAAFVVNELVAQPVFQKAAKVFLPQLLSKIQKELRANVSEQLLGRLDILKAKMGDGNLLRDSPEEEAEIRRIERKLRRRRRVKFTRKASEVGVIGVAAAFVGVI